MQGALAIKCHSFTPCDDDDAASLTAFKIYHFPVSTCHEPGVQAGMRCGEMTSVSSSLAAADTSPHALLFKKHH